MGKNINIAESEWRIMEIVWKDKNISFGDIKNRLSDIDWSDSTIKTFLRRLVKKKALGYEGIKGHYTYYPLVSENECRLNETKNLINRIYHGSVKMLMTNLVSNSKLSDEEVKRLMEIIDKME